MSRLTINIIMLKYIKEWIKDYNEATKEFHKMGFFTLGTWFGSYTYLDKEMYNEYHDRQRQISERNNQSKR